MFTQLKELQMLAGIVGNSVNETKCDDYEESTNQTIPTFMPIKCKVIFLLLNGNIETDVSELEINFKRGRLIWNSINSEILLQTFLFNFPMLYVVKYTKNFEIAHRNKINQFTIISPFMQGFTPIAKPLSCLELW